MKIFKSILDIVVKVVSAALMLLVAGIVGMMLTELIARNFFNKSFRFSTELCGFMFMWMAFLGVIVLYHRNALISLDILYRRVTGKVQLAFWFVGKVAAIVLGVTMIAAYKGMYPINATSYFSTMQFLSKAWHFLPMALAGGYLVIESVYQVLAKLLKTDNQED